MNAIEKLRLITQGQIVVCSDEELDAMTPFDASNLIRSRPNPKQVGTKDTWECWIEYRSLERFRNL